MAESNYPKIVCLSNVFDQNYPPLRRENLAPVLSSPKRRDLFRCLELATEREVVVLSSPPRSRDQRTPRWLPAIATKFSTHRQFFCANWDAPKLRIPLSWIFYARHVLRHVRSGDVVLIDNYEFIYVFAAMWLKLFRRVTFILEYEDGKHLIDRGWDRVLSGLAEKMGRGLIRAAILAHPSLGSRLPKEVPTLLVPGFVSSKNSPENNSAVEGKIQFLYSGSLDYPRGVDLLLATLPLLPDTGWHLHITGAGTLEKEVAKTVKETRWKNQVTFHGALATADYASLIRRCQVGLNCQRLSDPISAVTFPSKIFSYLSAGLLVVSSRASAVAEICGNACFYYPQETPQSLADAMGKIISDFAGESRKLDLAFVSGNYSIEATTARLRRMFQASGVVKK